MKTRCPSRRAALWGGLLLWLAAAAAAQETARLSAVRHVILERELETLIRVEGPFEYRFRELRGPKRLVIDLTPVGEILPPEEIRVAAHGVVKIRAWRPEPGTARVEFHLDETPSFYLINRVQEGVHVVFLSGPSGRSAAIGQPEPLPAPRAASPAADAAPRRLTTRLGLSLVNVSLADDRFQTVFAVKTASTLALKISQDVLSRGSWVVAAAVEYERYGLEGESTLTARGTKVTIAPLSLSLQAAVRAGPFLPYLAGGAVFSRYEETSPLRDTAGSAMGLGLQGGIYWGPASLPSLKAGAFVKWTRAVAKENGIEVNLGGLEVGAGLSLGFSLF